MFALPLLFALAPVATDFTVGPPGSGADFEDLQSAVDASTGPGDRVFVMPGTYFGSVTIDKPIDLLGSGPDQSLLSPTIGAGIAAEPHITVLGLEQGEQVRITGFGTVGVPLLSGEIQSTNVVVSGCSGGVTLADLDLGGVILLAVKNATEVVLVENSDQVVIDRCTISASPSIAVAPDGGAEGTPALRLESSSVWVNDSILEGARGEAQTSIGPSSELIFGGRGGPGIVASDSLVVLAGVQLAGGDGDEKLGLFGPSEAREGGVAARLDDGSFLQVAGGAWSSLAGGSGGFIENAELAVGAGAPGVDLRGGSGAQFSIGVTVEGGFDGLGQNQAPPVVDDCGGCGTPGISFYLAAMRASATRLQPGEQFTLEVQSTPDTFVMIYSDNSLVTPMSLPGLLGLAQLAPSTSEALLPVLTDAAGFASKQVTVPLQAFPGSRRYLQAVSVGEFSVNAISPPAFATVSF